MDINSLKTDENLFGIRDPIFLGIWSTNIFSFHCGYGLSWSY